MSFSASSEYNGGSQQCLCMLDGVLSQYTLHLDRLKNLLKRSILEYCALLDNVGMAVGHEQRRKKMPIRSD